MRVFVGFSSGAVCVKGPPEGGRREEVGAACRNICVQGITLFCSSASGSQA